MSAITLQWQQKAAAMRALVGGLNYAIHQRDNDEWYVSAHGLSISNGSTETSGAPGMQTPEGAIEAHWARHVEQLQDGEALAVYRGDTDAIRYFRWNGFMWEDVSEQHRARHSKEAQP